MQFAVIFAVWCQCFVLILDRLEHQIILILLRQEKNRLKHTHTQTILQFTTHKPFYGKLLNIWVWHCFHTQINNFFFLVFCSLIQMTHVGRIKERKKKQQVWQQQQRNKKITARLIDYHSRHFMCMSFNDKWITINYTIDNWMLCVKININFGWSEHFSQSIRHQRQRTKQKKNNPIDSFCLLEIRVSAWKKKKNTLKRDNITQTKKLFFSDNLINVTFFSIIDLYKRQFSLKRVHSSFFFRSLVLKETSEN